MEKNFLSELKAASEGKKSSLSFIRNKISPKPLVTNGTVQAIVVGGSNFIASRAKITDGKAEILETKKGALPVFKTGENFGIFLGNIFDEKTEAIGLNFAFPLDPVVSSAGQLDGELIGGTKEHTFEGLIGQSIGEFVRGVFFTKFGKHIPVTVANDSICLTLSGSGYEDCGLIVGTGINLSLKITENGEKSVVNLEAGNFSGFDISEELKKIDAISEYPGTMLFEKAVSGKYLVAYFNGQTAKEKLDYPILRTTEELSIWASDAEKPGNQLALTILNSSSSLVAAALTGTYDFLHKPQKLEFITEGSLFWKGYNYKENVQKQLLQLGVPIDTIKFKYLKDSSIKGALGLIIN